MSAKSADTTNTLQRKDNGNIEIKITIPWSEISTAYETKLNQAVAAAEIPGFRKGKAPREMVEPKLDRSELISQALGDLLPVAYSKLVETLKLKPILYPQIHIDKGKEGEDWEFSAITCEAPAVNLPDYKHDLPNITVKPDQSKLSAAIEYLKDKTKVSIPDLLVEEETNHRLSSLVENLSKIGMSMEKYLQTKKITAEDLKAQSAQSARLDLEIEFALAQIQTDEKLTDRNKTIEFIQSLIQPSK
jgi:FKBP-type peptidyl-prolyl cis-trans isomerase (trigger factor)